MKKIKEIIVLVVFVLGVLAILYIVLVLISFAAMLDGGGSGDILKLARNAEVLIPAVILIASLHLTWKKAGQIMMAER